MSLTPVVIFPRVNEIGKWCFYNFWVLHQRHWHWWGIPHQCQRQQKSRPSPVSTTAEKPSFSGVNDIATVSSDFAVSMKLAELSDFEPIWYGSYQIGFKPIKYWTYQIGTAPTLSDTEPIIYWTSWLPKDSEPVRFQAYKIPNLTDSEPIRYWNHHIPNLSNSEPFRIPGSITLLIQIRRWLPIPPVAKMGTEQIHPSNLSPPHPSSWWPPAPQARSPVTSPSPSSGWPSTPLSMLLGEVSCVSVSPTRR